MLVLIGWYVHFRVANWKVPSNFILDIF